VGGGGGGGALFEVTKKSRECLKGYCFINNLLSFKNENKFLIFSFCILCPKDNISKFILKS
jgi:hypothetical protein